MFVKYDIRRMFLRSRPTPCNNSPAADTKLNNIQNDSNIELAEFDKTHATEWKSLEKQIKIIFLKQSMAEGEIQSFWK
jgi:hypothetical protein